MPATGATAIPCGPGTVPIVTVAVTMSVLPLITDMVLLPGTSAIIRGAQLQGPLSAKGAGTLVVCGTTISGAVEVTGATGPVLLGAGSTCAPDTLGGAVSLTGNTTGVVLAGGTISGAVSLTRNATAVVVAGNTIGGSLSCDGNNPAPTDNGRPNTVTGLASGQCAALT